MIELREKYTRSPPRSFRSYLQLAGTTQAQLARALGVSPVAVYQWTAGKTYPSMDLLPELSRILGISLDDLVPAMIRDRRSRP